MAEGPGWVTFDVTAATCSIGGDGGPAMRVPSDTPASCLLGGWGLELEKELYVSFHSPLYFSTFFLNFH